MILFKCLSIILVFQPSSILVESYRFRSLRNFRNYHMSCMPKSQIFMISRQINQKTMKFVADRRNAYAERKRVLDLLSRCPTVLVNYFHIKSIFKPRQCYWKSCWPLRTSLETHLLEFDKWGKNEICRFFFCPKYNSFLSANFLAR